MLNTPQEIAISKGQKYIPSQMQNEWRVMPLFVMSYGLCSPKASAAGGLHRKMWTFFGGFFALSS